MHVIIVGCGLAGLALALGLLMNDNANITIEAFEKSDDLHERRGATFGLALNGQIALHEVFLSTSKTSSTLPWWEV